MNSRLILLLLLAVAPGCVAVDPPAVVPEVDLSRYAGTWYEIASYPTTFQADCTGTTATYAIRDDGKVTVFNKCFLGSLDGRENTITGVARVVDAAEPAKLAVSFFGPFEAPYWIIELEPDYQYAVVSEPTRSFLWILSRTPQMEEQVFAGLLAELESRGFDVSRLRRTLQAE
jgi:apolipoprotein D and lipocalin family protein